MMRLQQILSSPTTKRYAIAIPVSLGIWLLYNNWFGGLTKPTGFLIGVSVYLLTDWALLTQQARQARIHRVVDYLGEEWTTVIKVVLYSTLLVYFLSSWSTPTEPAVQQLFSLVQILGFIAIFTAPVVRMFTTRLRHGVWFSDRSWLTALIFHLLGGFLFYSAALWLIGCWVLTNHEVAAIYVVALVIIWVIVHLSSSLSYQEGLSRSVTIAGGMVAPASKLTARDNRYIAAHEAGHTLVCAALGRLPPDIRLVIHERSDHNGTLRSITGIDSQHQLDEKTFAEWYMLVLLAGKVGESIDAGETVLSNGTDHTKWITIARQYLSSHYRGVFYTRPNNRYEQEWNDEKLNVLQADQQAVLEQLFNLNPDVFQELIDMLLARRQLTRAELIPFLSRVEFPDDFPFPFGPFDRFSAEWPEDCK